ncbi:MBL fold metallo-hydrolase [Paraeggerthella sp.]|uniref:MBL fold metallo-hydrolase n=1 Tax=Paraeggerthella sp. TaxID=2897350 RepID=UPI003526CF0C
MVDPGPALPVHLDAVHAACEEDGLRVAAVVLTHDHYDHAEGAQQFARRGEGAPARASCSGRFRRVLLTWGQMLLRSKRCFCRVHSKDSIGLVFPKDGSVVTGDHVFRQSSTLICWPDGTLSDYLVSLERLRRIVRTRRIRVLLTAHGLPIDDPLGLIDRQTAHRLSRLDRVRKIVAAGAGFDVDRILETVYDDVDARLNPAARVNVQAQIAYLQEEAASSTRI